MNQSLYGIASQTNTAKKQKEVSFYVMVAVLRALIAPAEVLLRRKVGERYFNSNVLAFNVLAVFLLGFVTPPALKGYIWAIPIFLFLGMSWHTSVCFRRDRRGEYWHSYSDGESRLRLAALEHWLAQRHFQFDSAKMLLEPLFLVVVTSILGMLLGGNWSEPSSMLKAPFLVKLILAFVFYFGLVWIAMILYQSLAAQIQKEITLDGKDAAITAEQSLQNGSLQQGAHGDRGQVIAPPAGKAMAQWKP
ncbi:hypothetical protein [Cerasicoccus fimbriatus]|uniref:hypothetical protein n=1 Tax=Cerasicoccus fimbriatus TaxID=3014554 RepID=UPI0022B4BD3B|nr:hypothetical protein [Cerasicoccus sp. TK19100]